MKKFESTMNGSFYEHNVVMVTVQTLFLNLLQRSFKSNEITYVISGRHIDRPTVQYKKKVLNELDITFCGYQSFSSFLQKIKIEFLTN